MEKECGAKICYQHIPLSTCKQRQVWSGVRGVLQACVYQFGVLLSDFTLLTRDYSILFVACYHVTNDGSIGDVTEGVCIVLVIAGMLETSRYHRVCFFFVIMPGSSSIVHGRDS
jgi:hypothetical protein